MCVEHNQLSAAVRAGREYETHWRMNADTRSVFDRCMTVAERALSSRSDLVALDVGCGRQSNIAFPNTAQVIGLDVDRDGLMKNQTITRAVVGDALHTQIPTGTIDAIACIFTLEHVESPHIVFGRLARGLRGGGVMIIAVPHMRSLKAIVTKRTPYWFHVWFYRRMLGRVEVDSGLPFRTVLDERIHPQNLRQLASACDLQILYEELYEDNKQKQVREKVKLEGGAWTCFRRIVRVLLRHDPADTDYVAVYQRLNQDPDSGISRVLDTIREESGEA